MEDFNKKQLRCAKTIPKISKGTTGRSLEVIETAEKTKPAMPEAEASFCTRPHRSHISLAFSR
jgi:hypothetical protein